MPFGSYETGVRDAVMNAMRMLKEGGVDAVKLEGEGANREAGQAQVYKRMHGPCTSTALMHPALTASPASIAPQSEGGTTAFVQTNYHSSIGLQ
jgi:hypothetical protein